MHAYNKKNEEIGLCDWKLSLFAIYRPFSSLKKSKVNAHAVYEIVKVVATTV